MTQTLFIFLATSLPLRDEAAFIRYFLFWLSIFFLTIDPLVRTIGSSEASLSIFPISVGNQLSD